MTSVPFFVLLQTYFIPPFVLPLSFVQSLTRL